MTNGARTFRREAPTARKRDVSCRASGGSRPKPAVRFAPPRSFSMLGTILLIVLILFLVGALPSWPHSASWGYYPSGGIGLLLIIVIVLLLMGRI
jgi:hypothetical protein